MSNKSSWRFQFIDINKSVTIPTDDSPDGIGYIVVRAPKGLKEAQYFVPGSEEGIKAMIGNPSADWPDIQQAIKYNQDYGLYVSAPPGNSTAYPSYYGGAYFTTYGLLDFYHVTDKDNPNYLAHITPGTEKTKLGLKSVSTLEITLNGVNYATSEPTEQGQIAYKGIPSAVIANSTKFDFTAWKTAIGDYSVKDGTIFTYYINKSNYCVYPVINDEVDETTVAGYIEKYIDEDTGSILYNLYLGVSTLPDDIAKNVGSVKTVNLSNAKDNGYFFIDFNQLVKYEYYYSEDAWASSATSKVDTSEETITSETTPENSTTTEAGVTTEITYTPTGNANEYKKVTTVTTVTSVSTQEEMDYAFRNSTAYSDIVNVILTSGKVTIDEKTTKIANTLAQRTGYLLDVSDNTLAYICQKSPTSIPTKITISNVTYDKYKYDLKLQYATGDINLDSLVVPGKALYDALVDSDLRLVVYNEDKTVNKAYPNGIYQYTVVAEDDETGEETYGWKNVTTEYATQRLCLSDGLRSSDDANDLIYDMFYIDDDGVMNKMYADSSIEEYKLEENTAFNSFTLACSEEDWAGEVTSGGSWTGSLDEYGEDEYGGGNYWLDVLPVDSQTYVEVHPVQKFDDFCEDGFYKGVRLDSTYTKSVVGERYVSKVVDENIADGKTGCEWNKKFTSVIKAGLVEATQPKYDDAVLVMEPSGQDTFTGLFIPIRKAHLMTHIIAPKVINALQFANTKTIAVNNRYRGVAEFVGEFQLYDSNLRKKYWMQPIGYVGAMLAKIIVDYYGGRAPAWLNDGGVGGQLDLEGVRKARWDFTDNDTKVLDEKGLNPIIYNSDDGLMITSQKTTELDAGDWSYLVHSLSFDLCKREIRDNVMRPQLMKPIDSYYMSIRQRDVDKILAKRTAGGKKCWTAAKCEIESVNNNITKAQRNFVIAVTVKVTPVSEGVTLTFTNVDQSTEIEES